MAENLYGVVEWGVLWVLCPSCHPTISVKVLKEIQSTDLQMVPGSHTSCHKGHYSFTWLKDAVTYVCTYVHMYLHRMCHRNQLIA